MSTNVPNNIQNNKVESLNQQTINLEQPFSVGIENKKKIKKAREEFDQTLFLIDISNVKFFD